MKRILHILMAAAAMTLALTACNKFGSGKHHETKLPEPKSGYFSIDDRSYTITKPRIQVRDRQNGSLHFEFYDDNYNMLEVSVPSEYLDKKVDLTKIDPLSESKNNFYDISFGYHKLACGSHIQPVLSQEGSYVTVGQYTDGSYSVEISLKTEDGNTCALKFSGRCAPFFNSENKGEIFYNGNFYIVNKLTYQKVGSTGCQLNLEATGLTVAIVLDEYNRGAELDLSKKDPVAEMTGKTVYDVSYKPSGSSWVSLANGRGSTSDARWPHAGSEMNMWWMTVDGSPVFTGNVFLVTHNRELSVNIFNYKVTAN